MELVYLWVKDYKNIQKQGFNFSPRFTCNYDDVKNELTIDENDDYIENFFGDNINVTAIVGKNGSGKSNLFEALLSNLMHNNVIPIDEPYQVLAVFYSDDKKKYCYSKLGGVNLNIFNKEDITTIGNFRKYEKDDNSLFTFHYNYSLDWINNNENNLDFDKLYHKNDDYATPILLQPNKANRKISLSNIDYLATKDILYFTIKNNIEFDFIKDFFIPVSCELSNSSDNISKNNSFILKKVEDISSSYSDKKKYSLKSYYYILRKTIDKGKDDNYTFINDPHFKSLLEKDNLDENFDSLISYIKKHKFDTLYDNSYIYKIRKIEDTFNFLEYIENCEIESITWDLLHGKKNIIENKELLLNLPPYVDIDFFDKNNVSFYSLSYGQKFIIKFIYSLLNQLENLKSHPEYKHINLLLDEVEQGLHPEWQRRFLNILIQVLEKKKDYTFNIICATHSPFILSDIPNENIYFLRDGQKDIGLKQQTFGANIHTLLSDSFFMEDGLMGEFAKGKLNEIIEFFDDKNELYTADKERLYQIINTIGEPFLKEKLLFMYSERFPKTKEEQIAEYEAKIERLKSDDWD